MKNLQEVLDLMMPLGAVLEKSMEDDKLDYKDALKFLPLLKLVGPAFNDANKILDEMANSSDQEWSDFLAYAKNNFNLKDDVVEAQVESALEVAVELAKFVAGFRKP